MQITQETAYVQRLRKVRDFILIKPRTAREVAEHLKCTKMTAYSLLKELEERGALIATMPAERRPTSRGPTGFAFKLKRPIPLPDPE